MTGWRAGAMVGNADVVDAYWRLKTNMDSGMFGAVQHAAAAALTGPQDSVRELCALYSHRRDLLVAALRRAGMRVDPPKGTHLPVGAGARGPHLGQLRRARPEPGRRDRLARARPTARRARATCASRSPCPTSACARRSSASPSASGCSVCRRQAQLAPRSSP